LCYIQWKIQELQQPPKHPTRPLPPFGLIVSLKPTKLGLQNKKKEILFLISCHLKKAKQWMNCVRKSWKEKSQKPFLKENKQEPTYHPLMPLITALIRAVINDTLLFGTKTPAYLLLSRSLLRMKIRKNWKSWKNKNTRIVTMSLYNTYYIILQL